MTTFHPKSIFITGCNRGIGLEYVKQFLRLAEPPRKVFATCRDPEKATELVKLAKENDSLHVIKHDVTDYEHLPEVVKEVESKLQGEGLNLLINNAGILEKYSLDELTPKAMRESFETNTVAPLMITKAFLPLLKQAAKESKEQGRNFSRAGIVMMSSKVGSCGDNGMGGVYNYRASKAAMNVCSVSLMRDLVKYDIVTAVLHPGWVKTEMGGPNALISVEKCVQGLIDVITGLNDSNMVRFLDYKNELIPW